MPQLPHGAKDVSGFYLDMLSWLWHERYPAVPITAQTTDTEPKNVQAFGEFIELRERYDVFDALETMINRTMNRFGDLLLKAREESGNPHGGRIILQRCTLAPMGLSAWIMPLSNDPGRFVLQVSWNGYAHISKLE